MNKNIWCHRCGYHWVENFSVPDDKFGEAANLREQLADVENQRKDWQEKYERIWDVNKQMHGELANLRAQLAETDKRLDEWTITANNRLDHALKLDAQLQASRKLVEGLESENENLRKKVDHLEQSSDNWEKLFADETRKWDSRIAELQNDLANEQMCHRVTTNSIVELRAQFDILTIERDEALKYKGWCAEWHEKYNKETSRLRNEIHALENRLEASRKLVDGLHAENGDLRNSRTAWKKAADKFQSEADALREENRRLTESHRVVGERLIQVTNENNRLQELCGELESFRKLSGEFASWSKRDAIREANKRLQQENQQHAQQIKSLQADLNEAIKKNSTFAYIEAEKNGWKLSAEENKAVANSLQQRLNEATKNLETHETAWCINWQEKVRKLKGQITILAAARDHWQTESDNWRMKHNELFDDNEALKTIRDSWEKTAQQESNNAAWYRGILDAIGNFFGDAAKTNDLGEITDGIFYSKLPKLIEQLCVHKIVCLDCRDLRKSLETIQEFMNNKTVTNYAGT